MRAFAAIFAVLLIGTALAADMPVREPGHKIGVTPLASGDPVWKATPGSSFTITAPMPCGRYASITSNGEVFIDWECVDKLGVGELGPGERGLAIAITKIMIAVRNGTWRPMAEREK